MKRSSPTPTPLRDSAIITVCAAGLLLGGCKGGDDAAPTDDGGGGAAAPATAAPAGPAKPARESATLAKKWPEGKKIVYALADDTKISTLMPGNQIPPSKFERGGEFAFDVPNGSSGEIQFLSMRFLNHRGGRTLSQYDTKSAMGGGEGEMDGDMGDEGNPGGGGGAASAPPVPGMEKVNGTKIKYNLGPDGSVLGFTGQPQAVAAIMAAVQPAHRLFAAAVFGTNVLRAYVPFHDWLPGKEVKLNESWNGRGEFATALGPLPLSYTNTLTAFTTRDGREVAEIGVTGSLSGNPKMKVMLVPGASVTGKMVYDIELGIVVERSLQSVFTKTSKLQNGTVWTSPHTNNWSYKVSKVMAAGAAVGGGGDDQDPDMDMAQ
jgi:hypothetical protein